MRGLFQWQEKMNCYDSNYLLFCLSPGKWSVSYLYGMNKLKTIFMIISVYLDNSNWLHYISYHTYLKINY